MGGALMREDQQLVRADGQSRVWHGGQEWAAAADRRDRPHQSAGGRIRGVSPRLVRGSAELWGLLLVGPRTTTLSPEETKRPPISDRRSVLREVVLEGGMQPVQPHR